MLSTLWLWIGFVPLARHLTALDLLSRARRERDELAVTCSRLLAETARLRGRGTSPARQSGTALKRYLNGEGGEGGGW